MCNCGLVSTCDACALRWVRSLSAPLLETAIDAVSGRGPKYPLLESNERCRPDKTYLISEVTGGIMPGASTAGAAQGIVESTEQKVGGPLIFHGKFQEANTVNKNRRRYSKLTLERQTNKLIPIASERGLYGELDHPSDAIIHFADASHLILGFNWDNNVLYGRAEVIPTPAGKILEAVFKARGKVGISSRGLGSGVVGPDGVLDIDENFNLLTYDAVCDPSTHKAFQTIAEAAGISTGGARRIGQISESLFSNDRERANALTQETLRSMPNLPGGAVDSVCLRSENSEQAANLIINLMKLMVAGSK